MTDRNHTAEPAEVPVDEDVAHLGDDAGPPDDAGTTLDDMSVVEAEIVSRGDETPSAAELGLELPESPAETRQLLLRELAEARAEASEYLETLQRIAADFENYRRRTERDQVENVLRASQRIIESLLPTLDAFDAAVAYEPQSPAEDKLLDGMRGTRAQLVDALAKEGLEPIATEGEPFDPALHEAVSGGGEGDLVVARELRRGYTLRGRVVRPSMVAVEPKD